MTKPTDEQMKKAREVITRLVARMAVSLDLDEIVAQALADQQAKHKAELEKIGSRLCFSREAALTAIDEAIKVMK